MSKFLKKPKNLKDVVIILAVIAAIGAGVWAIWFRGGDEVAVGEIVYLTTEIQPTMIMDQISGSGNLVASDTAEIRNAVAGKIAEIYVKNGDWVEKDQPLYRMTNDSLVTALQQAQVDAATAKNNYDRLVMQTGNASGELRDAQLKVEQRQNALDTQLTNRKNLQVFATESGHITDVHVRVGDDVSSGTALFGFYSDEKEDGVDYQIKLQQAKANMEAKLKDFEKLTVTADFAGEVADLSVKEGDSVLANDLLLNIKEPDRLAKTTNSETVLKIQQAQLNLDTKAEDVANLEVKAPTTGLLSDLKLLPGESVTTSTSLASVSDNRQVVVQVSVTQSFINGVARGNKAEVMITNSARTYQGTVTDVSPKGDLNPSTNVVSYPVEITIDNDGTLLAGMSALVSITSSDATFRSVSSLRGTLVNDVTKTVTPKVSGEIVELRAKSGDWVLEGQVIAVLKNESVDLAYRQAVEDLNKLMRDEFRSPGIATVQTLAVQNGAQVEKGQVLMTLKSDSVEAAYLQAKIDYEKLLNREAGNTEIRNKVAGTLEAIYIRAGDTVQEGQLLAELSSSELNYQEQRALTDLEQAKAELQALLQNTSAGELELARLRLDQANLTVESKQKSVDDLVVKALISGSITEKISVTVGDELEALTQLCTIYDYSAYKLIINVDELEIPKIQIGSDATVTVDAFSGRIFPAKVTEISREGSVMQGGSGSSFPVTVSFTTDEALRAAMTATAQIVMQQSENTFAVVKSAITALPAAGGQTTYRCYIQSDPADDTTIKMVDIEVGIITSSMAEITSGVKEGDLVVTGYVNSATGEMQVMGSGMGNNNSMNMFGGGRGGMRTNVVMIP